jgi:hypothetical protein
VISRTEDRWSPPRGGANQNGHPGRDGPDPLGLGRQVLGPDAARKLEVVAEIERGPRADGRPEACAVGAVAVDDARNAGRPVLAVVGEGARAVGERVAVGVVAEAAAAGGGGGVREWGHTRQ